MNIVPATGLFREAGFFAFNLIGNAFSFVVVSSRYLRYYKVRFCKFSDMSEIIFVKIWTWYREKLEWEEKE